MITYKDIQKNKEINVMIEQGNQVLKTLGYTEHSKKHALKVAEYAAEILKITGADAHQIELAQIAGYMHDIGNCINRQDHAHSGAILTYSILKELDMPLSDRLTIVTAIGHHDEKTGTALDPVSAALILVNLELDDSMCTVMDYFGIFLERMMMCRRAAEVLGWRFKLVANGSKLC